MRKSVALVLTAGCVVALAGCSPISQLAQCAPETSSGPSSSTVSVTGTFLSQPTVGFPMPLIVTKTETSTISLGDGPVLEKGMVADVQAALYLGATGTLLGTSGYDLAKPVRVNVGGAKNAIGDSMECLTVGSRVATVLTAAQFYAASPENLPGSLKPSDTLVFVTDIQRAFPGRSDGIESPPQAGFPTVVLAPDGTPGVSLPHTAPPKDLRIEVVRAGSGATVNEGDTVVIHFTGILWDTAKVFESSWTTKQPVNVLASLGTAAAASSLPPGLVKAMIGQKVGSQVLVVIPPKFGYAPGNAPSSVPDGSTMVFVFDILGII